MSGSTWSLWAVPAVTAVCLAIFIGSVFMAERAQQRGNGSITPRDRWLAGGVFRRDPRAGNSREEMPPPEELRSAQHSAADDELSRVPARRQSSGSTDSGAPLPGPREHREPQAARR